MLNTVNRVIEVPTGNWVRDTFTFTDPNGNTVRSGFAGPSGRVIAQPMLTNQTLIRLYFPRTSPIDFSRDSFTFTDPNSKTVRAGFAGAWARQSPISLVGVLPVSSQVSSGASPYFLYLSTG